MNVHSFVSLLIIIITLYLIIPFSKVRKRKGRKFFLTPVLQSNDSWISLKISFSLFHRTNNYSKVISSSVYFFLDYSITFRGCRIRAIWPRIGREIETFDSTKHFHRSRFARFSRARKWPAAKPRLRIRSISTSVDRDLDRSGCICVAEIWRAQIDRSDRTNFQTCILSKPKNFSPNSIVNVFNIRLELILWHYSSRLG